MIENGYLTLGAEKDTLHSFMAWNQARLGALEDEEAILAGRCRSCLSDIADLSFITKCILVQNWFVKASAAWTSEGLLWSMITGIKGNKMVQTVYEMSFDHRNSDKGRVPTWQYHVWQIRISNRFWGPILDSGNANGELRPASSTDSWSLPSSLCFSTHYTSERWRLASLYRS